MTDRKGKDKAKATGPMGKGILRTKPDRSECVMGLATEKNDFQKADKDIQMMKFDWDAVLCMIVIHLDSPWIYGPTKPSLKAIAIKYLTIKVWLWEDTDERPIEQENQSTCNNSRAIKAANIATSSTIIIITTALSSGPLAH
ncbi:hypothetical protein AHAS_Ahas14G0102100 [Arachis hypogaea]